MEKDANTLSKKDFYTYGEFVSKFGSQYSKTIEFALVCKEESLFNHYKNDNVIKIKNNHGEEKKVSEDLIVDLINNKYGMYSYLINNLNNHLGIAVKMCYFDDKGNLVDNIVITLAELKLFLNKIDSDKINTLAFSPLISSITSYKKLQRTYANVTRDFVLDNEVITKPISSLIQILLSSDEDFYLFIKENEDARKILYMLVEFVEKDRILDKYVLPMNIHQRYLDIKTNKFIDIETINSDIKTQDPDSIDNQIINDIKIEDSMESYVKKYIKQTYSTIEIAIHLYIRLCELVCERPYEYSGEVGTLEKKTDTKEENQINYYYFRLIYAAILKKYGINYNTQKNTFVVGEYKLHIDDLNMNNKNIEMQDIINNLICINQMDVTRDKFNELFNKVLDNILTREVKKEKFIVALDKYERENYQVIQDNGLEDEEKAELIVLAVLHSDLSLYDSIEYQKKVMKIADDVISCVFVNTDDGIKTIIRVAPHEEEYYFIIDPRERDKIERVFYKDLVKLFHEGKYSYIANSTETIRGI